MSHLPTSSPRVEIAGVVAHLPPAVRTSAEVEERITAASPGFSCPPGIVTAMTGIRSRHVLPDDEQASDLAAHAVRKLLAGTGADASDVDLLVFGSASQDCVEPATANMVAAKTDLACPVLDTKDACNSFLKGVQVAEALIATRQSRCAVVAVGETPSRAIRWRIRDLDQLRMSFAGYTFGDAGAAVLLRSAAPGTGRGIRYRQFASHSRFWDVGTLPGGGSMHPRDPEHSYFHGDGSRLKEVFASIGAGIVEQALAATGTTYDDYERVLVHQVTGPFLDAFLAETGVPPGKVVRLVEDLGNMAAATLPVQLAVALERGELVVGDDQHVVGLAGGASLGVLALTL
jgi:3-oxoacyl-[acyl-carrier-protein] synthase-3